MQSTRACMSASLHATHTHAHSPNNVRSSSSKDPFVWLVGKRVGRRMGRRVGDCREGRDTGKGDGEGTGVSNWTSNREGVEAESNRDTGQSSDGYWSLVDHWASQFSRSRLNKIATRATPQMAADKEAVDLSRVHMNYSKFNPPSRDICLFSS